MSQALIRRDDAALSIDFTPAAVALKDDALNSAANVWKVNDAATQEAAVQAQQKIADALGLVEKARIACKAPLLEFGRLIDAKARQFCDDLREERNRISSLVGDFQQLEQERVRRAQQAENERLSALEREKAAALAQASSHEELDKVQQQFDARAQQEAPAEPIAPVRAEGQRVQEEWEVTITDIHLLYRHHPNCVKLEALTGEIKALLKAGTVPKGVTAKKVIKAGVSRARLPGIIDIASRAA